MLIPKLAFTYWSGDQISYLHLLTIKTFMHFHPEWQFILYTDDKSLSSNERSYSSHEHQTKIKKTFTFDQILSDQVTVVEVDFREEYGIKDASLFHTYLADIIRIKKLAEHGGLWVDMDLFFLKAIPEEFLSGKYKDNRGLVVTTYCDTIATGLVAGVQICSRLKAMSEEVDKYLAEGSESNFGEDKKYTLSYQAFGPDLWRKFHEEDLKNPKSSQSSIFYDSGLVYPYIWNEMDKFFYEDGSLPKKAFSVHWYNGSELTKKFINEDLYKCNLDSPRTPFEHCCALLRDAGLDIDFSLAEPDTDISLDQPTTSLRGANLQGVNFTNADLADVDLSYANLTNAILDGANLTNADLRFANLTNASLKGAMLQNALLKGASLRNVKREDIQVVASQPILVSIVIAYHNRKEQLKQTLHTITKSDYRNIEVIIVDDGSDEGERVDEFIGPFKDVLNIKVITITPATKGWRNPAGAYNLGIKYASGTILILQNAEVVHIGDCISYAVKHLNPKDWLTFNCFGLGDEKENLKLAEDGWGVQTTFDYLKTTTAKGGNSVAVSNPRGWLNHADTHFVAYHYCGAIYREDLMGAMGGGFNVDFYDVIGGDDDEFVKRLIYNKFRFKISQFSVETPFTVHQYHRKTKSVEGWDKESYRKTKLKLAKHLIRMGFAPEVDISLAPVDQTPKAHKTLVP